MAGCQCRVAHSAKAACTVHSCTEGNVVLQCVAVHTLLIYPAADKTAMYVLLHVFRHGERNKI